MKIQDIKPNPNNPRLIKESVLVCKTCGAEFQSKKTCKTRTPKYCSKELNNTTNGFFGFLKKHFDEI